MIEAGVRPPVCADDRWYPRDPDVLRTLVDRFLASVPTSPNEGGLLGLITPHAGYAFSGQTASYAYAELAGRDFNRVALIGPSHFQDYGSEAVTQSDFYRTPLGDVAIDADAVNELNHRLGINFVPRDHEHSLEMQLPFLQRQLQAFKIVPIMMSHPFYIYGIHARNDCENLGAALAAIMDDRTLLVASSDLSHLHDYEAVAYFDQVTENLISDYDIGGLIDHMINEGECRACGDVAIITILSAAKARGANRARVLFRTNSGEITGIKEPGQYTVGYMAAALYKAGN